MLQARGRALLVVCSALVTFAAGMAQAELLWSGDATRPKSEVFKSLGSAGNCGEPSSLNPVQDAARGTVWEYRKPAESNRCENHGIKVDGKSFVFENNHTYFLGWWSKISNGANNNANFQWKSYGEGHEQNFPIVLKMQEGQLQLMQRQPDKVETILWREKLSVNQWNHFALGLHLSSETRGGWIEFWFNGVQQTFTTGGTRYACRLFDSGNHNCPKWGVYGGRGQDMTNLIDDLKVGTTVADVLMPGAPSTPPAPPPPPPNTPPSPPAPPPDPMPGPGPGALSFEAEHLDISHSGTGFSVQSDPMTSGGLWISLDAENIGSWMEFTLPDVPAGSYDLQLSYKTNDSRGQLVVRVDANNQSTQLGDVLDQFATDASYETASIGQVSFPRAGDHKVRLVVVGQNESSEGFLLSADRFTLNPVDVKTASVRDPNRGIASKVFGGCQIGGRPAAGSAPGLALLVLLGVVLRRRRWLLAAATVLSCQPVALPEEEPVFEPPPIEEVLLPAVVALPPPPPSPPLPSFPNRTCNVKDHDAAGNGSSDDTGAINEAIATCNAAGGGTVSFPSGTYMVGSIHLRSNIRLLLQAGATIRARSSGFDEPESSRWGDFQDFGHSHFRNAMMWGEGISNFAIEGPGRIDGAGLTDSDGPDDGQGDKQVSCKSCDRLLFRNLTQTKGGHFFYLLTDCKNVTLDNLSLSDGRDGANLVGCRNCEVSNLRVRNVGDDAVPLKNDYSVGKRLLTENVYIHDSTFETGCNAVQVGSETAGDFRNVWFKNITVLQAGKAGIGLQSNDGAIVENFYIDNINIKRAANPIYINSSARLRTPEKVGVGRVRNIYISNVTITDVEQSNDREPVNTATISGRPGIVHENINLTNVRITVPGGGSFADGQRQPLYTPDDNYNPRSIGTRPAFGFFVRHVRGLSVHNVSVDFQSNDLRPAWNISDADSVELDGIGVERASSGAHPSLVLRNVRNFALHDSPQFPRIQLATVPTASYTPSSGTLPPPKPPVPPPPTTMPPPPTMPPPAPPPPTTGGLRFEAEELANINSGTGTTVQLDAGAGGGRWVSLDAENLGSWMEFTLPDVPAGTYTVKLAYKSSSDRSRLMLWVDGTNMQALVGEPIDQYSSSQGYPTASFGTVSFATAGDHKFRLIVVGQNESSRGFVGSADAFILE